MIILIYQQITDGNCICSQKQRIISAQSKRGRAGSRSCLNRSTVSLLALGRSRRDTVRGMCVGSSMLYDLWSTDEFIRGRPVLPDDLASDIQQFVQTEFARQYFSTHRTGFIFRRKVPVERMMMWQKVGFLPILQYPPKLICTLTLL